MKGRSVSVLYLAPPCVLSFRQMVQFRPADDVSVSHRFRATARQQEEESYSKRKTFTFSAFHLFFPLWSPFITLFISPLD